MPLQGYHFTKPAPGIVEIHEEQFSYRMDEAALLEAIEHTKSEKASYTSEAFYHRVLDLYEGALDFLRKQP